MAKLKGKFLELASVAADKLVDDIALRGAPTAPTAAAGTKTGQIATTQFVDAAVVAAVGAEESARVAADAALDGRLDTIEGSGEGSIAKAKLDAIAAATALVDAESAARIAGDVAALADAKTYTDAETARATAAEGGLNTRLTTAEGEIDTLQSEMDAVEGRASALEGRMTTAEGEIDTLQSQVGVLNGNSAVQGSVDQKVASAVNSLLNGAPTAFDTLKEIADYIASDQSAGSSMLAQLGDHENRLDTLEGGAAVVGSVDYKVAAEAALRAAADAALDSRLDTLEAGDTVEGSVAKAEADAKAFAQSLVSAEETARIAAVSAEATARASADSTLQSSLNQEISDRAAAVLAEQQARAAADTALSGRIAVLEADPVTKAYVNTADAALDAKIEALTTDDVAEGVTNLYFTNARAKAAAVANQIGAGVTDVAPSQAAVATALAGKQNVITPTKNKIQMTSGILAAGFFELTATAIANTIVLYPVGAPVQEEGVDYTVQLAGGTGGVTKITMSADLIGMLTVADAIIVQYIA